MPYTTFAAGAVLTASQLNTNLRDQAVTPFTTTTARDSAITSPVEGMVCVVTGEDRLYVYDGAAWQRAGHYASAGRTGCSIQRVSGQSTTNNTLETVSWDTETQDTDGFITVTSPTITIPTGLGGFYFLTGQVTCSAVWGGNSADRFQTGGSITQTLTSSAVPTGYATHAFTHIMPFNAGNTLTIQFVHNAGAGITATADLKLYRLFI